VLGVHIFETFDSGLENFDRFAPPGFEFFVYAGNTGR
jgi:hypothetical protein